MYLSGLWKKSRVNWLEVRLLFPAQVQSQIWAGKAVWNSEINSFFIFSITFRARSSFLNVKIVLGEMAMVNFLQILKKEIRNFTFFNWFSNNISLKYFFSGVARLIVWQPCQPIWFRLRQEEKARKIKAKKRGLTLFISFSFLLNIGSKLLKNHSLCAFSINWFFMQFHFKLRLLQLS